MSGFSESSTVQAAIVERLTQKGLGWMHIPGSQLNRTSDGVLLEQDVIDALIRLNPTIAEHPERVDEILPILRAVVLSAITDGLVAANERMVTWMRGSQTHKFIGTEPYVPVRLIDFEHPRNNRLVVSGPGFQHQGHSAEVTYGVGAHARRFDVV